MPRLPLLALLVAMHSLAQAQPVKTPASTDPTWAVAAAEVAARARAAGADRRAKNIILFVGDGMGVSTVTAARIFEAQQRAKAAGGTFAGFAGGEENRLSFENLPATAMVKTYNTNAQVPDSAGTATAMTTGAKTRIGVLGMLSTQGAEACSTPEKLPRTIPEIASDRGLGIGIVTTTRITHATPAAMFAHAPDRDWEAHDRGYPLDARKAGCKDIASQLTAFPGGIDVALGGGLEKFRPLAAGGTRDDGRDLIAEWQGRFPAGRFVADAAGLRLLEPAAKGPVFGLFNANHLDFNFDADRRREPSLAEMAAFAVRKLQARGTGYVLMVEGGRIDHAHHLTNAYRALDETVEFAKAVDAVLKLVDLDDTLVLVTADHSHVFTMAGYPPRGNDILGYIKSIPGGESRTAQGPDGASLDDRGRPMTTLGYQNGPFAVSIGKQALSRLLPPTDPNYLSDKLHGLGAETHSGEDVVLYAAGPGSALVSGTLEQNSIFHIMVHALGWR